MLVDWQPVLNDFKAVVPAVDFWSLRLVHDETEILSVRLPGALVNNFPFTL